jgi:hypothetical protein
MAEKGIVATLEHILVLSAATDKDLGELRQRCVNVLGKVTKNAKGLMEVVNSKMILITLLTGYCSEIEEMNKSSLIAFHQCCKCPGFRELYLEKHEFKLETFDAFVKCSQERFNNAI